MFKTLTKFQALAGATLAACMLTLAGCATSAHGGNQNAGYGTTYSNTSRDSSSHRCPSNQCGVVSNVSQIYLQDNDKSNALGTIIGAVVGGALGNQVGAGDGRDAATIAGAVAGGAVGHHVAKGNDNSNAWRVVVQLNDGRTATVTQHDNPHVQSGDQVEVRDGHVYTY